MKHNSNCPNCETPVNGHYCSNCGQIQKDVKRFFWALINEAFEDVFSLNSRMWKTVVSLLFRPGFLTKEYFLGRRVRYVQPIRLYFVTSIAFFVMLSLVNFFNSGSLLIVSDEQVLPQQEQTEINSKTAPSNAAKPSQPSYQESVAEFEAEFDDDELVVDVPFASDATNRKLETLLRAQVEKTIARVKDDPGELFSVFIEIAPPVIFCLLPLFALLLKFCYLFKGVFYTEHLIFAVHNHSFVFLTLLLFSGSEILISAIGAHTVWPGILITIWLPLYLWLSLKRVYAQGVMMTTIKFTILGLSYCMLLAFGILLAMLIGIFTF